MNNFGGKDDGCTRSKGAQKLEDQRQGCARLGKPVSTGRPMSL